MSVIARIKSLGAGVTHTSTCTHATSLHVCSKFALYEWIWDQFMTVFIHKNEGCIGLFLGGTLLLGGRRESYPGPP